MNSESATSPASSMPVKLTVIIACFNGARTLPVQLDALRAQSWRHSWEVIVSDNGSTDDSLAVAGRCAESWPRLRVVRAADRPGKPKPNALNAALRVARG